MKKARKINGLNGTINKKPAFDHDQITKALLSLEDTFERAIMPFMLLEGAAKQLHEELPFELTELSVGVLRKDWTQYGSATFMMCQPTAQWVKDNIEVMVEGVPTVVWIIQKHYKFFERPDFRWFNATEFFIPNPFDRYWSSRFIIR
jgi:hypothetical protein